MAKKAATKTAAAPRGPTPSFVGAMAAGAAAMATSTWRGSSEGSSSAGRSTPKKPSGGWDEYDTSRKYLEGEYASAEEEEENDDLEAEDDIGDAEEDVEEDEYPRPSFGRDEE